MATTPTPILSNAATLTIQIDDSGGTGQTIGGVASMTIADTREEINITNLTSTLQETWGGIRQISVDLVIMATSLTSNDGYDALWDAYTSGATRNFRFTCADANIAYNGSSSGVCVVTRCDTEFPSPDSDVVRVNARLRINFIS